MGSLEMLRAPRDFDTLQRRGQSRAHPLLVVRYARNDLGRTRFGFSTSRRLGPAVVRNRVRRRMRELVRRLRPRLASGWDVLVVARAGAVTAGSQELATALERLLHQAGLLGSQGIDT
jgi:ribonuclease P protein component